jgi:hypothetical protein
MGYMHATEEIFMMAPLTFFFMLGSIGKEDPFYTIKQDSRFTLALSQNQARIRNLFKQHRNFKQDMRIYKVKISTSSKIQESKIQNLDYKQDSRMTEFLELKLDDFPLI